MARHSKYQRRLTLGDRHILTQGLPRRLWQDLYHFFMTVSWPRLFAGFAGYFLLFNLLFAALYRLHPIGITRVDPPGYWGLFFFSIETFATVGYGDMHPQALYAHLLASMEIFLSILSIALMTGMVFARFSRPSARFMFARHGVIMPLDGKPTLMLRAANARQNIIMEAQAQLRLMRDELTVEGFRIRRIYDLPLRRYQHPVFLFGWNLMHVIDETSPLHGQDTQSMAATRTTVMLTVSGTDETTGQTLMARQQYSASALHWNHRFIDILTTGADGVDRFDYTKFHDIEPLNS
ncbi:MAG: ion channel [Steroidobacteraceae bacterium]